MAERTIGARTSVGARTVRPTRAGNHETVRVDARFPALAGARTCSETGRDQRFSEAAEVTDRPLTSGLATM
ncbi:hypothetical protein JCM9957A_47700 [Kineosporia succinea]